MEQNAIIYLKNSLTDIRFEWAGFDGDDCFNNFHILIIEGTGSQRFDFGACAVFGLRKVNKFFSDTKQETAGLGFRNPDIRYCDVFREGMDYRLVIQFEGSNLHKEFCVNQPSIHVSNDFLKYYDNW